MENTFNRRSWLKGGMMAAGGLTLGTVLPWGASAEAANKPFWTNRPRLTTTRFPFMDYELKAKLNANENKFGPSPKAKAALIESVGSGNLYAHQEVMDLTKALAEKEGVKPEQIILGPGSTDLLEKTGVIMFMNGTGNIVSADPAYMSVIKTAQGVGATWKNIPCKADWSHDLDAMMAAIDSETKLIYVCNPNNPTGSITDYKKLWDFCAKASEKTPVFIDEAYLDFMAPGDQKSLVGLINEGKDIILARTFSKIHGMAGLRIGYVVAREDRIESINSILRSSYNLSVTSIKAALASLNDQSFLQMSWEKNMEAKEYVYGEFKKMGIDYIPSHTSFIFFPLSIDGDTYMEQMYSRGVGVRLFSVDGKPWGRVSMGRMDEVKLFTKTLGKVLA